MAIFFVIAILKSNCRSREKKQKINTKGKERQDGKRREIRIIINCDTTFMALRVDRFMFCFRNNIRTFFFIF